MVQDLLTTVASEHHGRGLPQCNATYLILIVGLCFVLEK